MNKSNPKPYFDRFHEHITAPDIDTLEVAYQRTEAELGPRFRTYASFRSSKSQYLTRQRRMRTALAQLKKQRRSL